MSEESQADAGPREKFEGMTEADPDPYWLEFQEGGYTLYLGTGDDREEVGTREGPLVGVLTAIDRNVGEGNDSTLYTVRTKVDPRPIKLWGSSHIDRQVQSAGIEVGQEIGIEMTGEEIDTGKGNPMTVYDVRYGDAE